MKFIKFVFALFALTLIIYAAIGNIYVWLFTGRELKMVSLSKYGGNIEKVGYEYDSCGRRYIFHTRDTDGVEAEFIYDTDNNSFHDGYAEISSRVLYYSVRGRMINKITSSGVLADDVTVIYENKICMIRDIFRIAEGITPDEIIVILDDGGSRETFCDMTVKVLKVFRDGDTPKITLQSEKHVMTVSDGMFPTDRNDVLLRIRYING